MRTATRRDPTDFARSMLIAVAAVMVGCAGSVRPGDVSPTLGDQFFVSGYHPYWLGSAWGDYPWDALDRLFFFEIEAAGDGTLLEAHGWPTGWEPLLARAGRAEVSVVPTLSMHDPIAFQELFQSPARVDRLVRTALDIVRRTPEVAGLHLDFEVFTPVPPEATEGFTTFVRSLGRAMTRAFPAKTLSAFVLAFDDDEVFDEPSIAAAVDYVVVQGYDYHSLGETTAGPVAALEGWGRLNWTMVVDRFLSMGIPARKIVMGVPLYGYEWPTTAAEPGASTRGPAVTLPVTRPTIPVSDLGLSADSLASTHGVRRDPESGLPYYAFEDGSGWYQGWFEDAESLRAKYDFVRARGLGGVALFPLAYGGEPLWDDLRDAFTPPRD